MTCNAEEYFELNLVTIPDQVSTHYVRLSNIPQTLSSPWAGEVATLNSVSASLAF